MFLLSKEAVLTSINIDSMPIEVLEMKFTVSKLSFIALLPNIKFSVNDLEKTLNDRTWQDIFTKLQSRRQSQFSIPINQRQPTVVVVRHILHIIYIFHLKYKPIIYALFFQMPKFDIDIDESLKDVLIRMGVSSMFNDSTANFSGFPYSDIYVDDVKHQVSLTVRNEF